MSWETSKQMRRRMADTRYATRWFKGDGIDIGAGQDSLEEMKHLLPLVSSVRSWDRDDGDATEMIGVEDNAYDFVHSSHCLEHLQYPYMAMSNWVRICKPGGHLLITVPDEDLYEQGVWPSTMNPDHKWSFTIFKNESWSPRSITIFDLLSAFVPAVEILKIELLDSGFKYGVDRHDQTCNQMSESGIEMVLRKR